MMDTMVEVMGEFRTLLCQRHIQTGNLGASGVGTLRIEKVWDDAGRCGTYPNQAVHSGPQLQEVQAAQDAAAGTPVAQIVCAQTPVINLPPPSPAPTPTTLPTQTPVINITPTPPANTPTTSPDMPGTQAEASVGSGKSSGGLTDIPKAAPLPAPHVGMVSPPLAAPTPPITVAPLMSGRCSLAWEVPMAAKEGIWRHEFIDILTLLMHGKEGLDTRRMGCKDDDKKVRYQA